MTINTFLSVIIIVALIYGLFSFIHWSFFYTAEKELKKRKDSECCSAEVFSTGDLDNRCTDCGNRCNLKKDKNECKI